MAAKTKTSSKELHRSTTNKVLGGVCGGLGEYLNIDPTIVRVLFIIVSVFGGTGVIAYFLMWLVIPSTDSKGDLLETNMEEIKQTFEGMANKHKGEKKQNSGFAWFLVLLGIIFLLHNFGYLNSFDFGKVWPAFLIIFGLLLLLKRK